MLVDEAFATCLESLSSSLGAVRSDTEIPSDNLLHAIVDTWWGWFRAHPMGARLVMLHHEGATISSRRASAASREVHGSRLYDNHPARRMRSRTSQRELENCAARTPD